MADLLPWKVPPLDGWSIVGMNHYHIGGVPCLYVAMTRNGQLIKVEGPDTPMLWDDLRDLAVAHEQNSSDRTTVAAIKS